jgi:hypothetical protein
MIRVHSKLNIVPSIGNNSLYPVPSLNGLVSHQFKPGNSQMCRKIEANLLPPLLKKCAEREGGQTHANNAA